MGNVSLINGHVDNADDEVCCDQCFYHVLTKEECLELSEMFKEIADELSN